MKTVDRPLIGLFRILTFFLSFFLLLLSAGG